MGNIIPDLESLARPLTDLHLWEQNPRKGDVAAVVRSYQRFGQRKPIVARRDGRIIAGNHQYLAAQELGWDRIAVVFTDDATADAYGLADNRTSDLGTYDDDALAALLTGLQDEADLLAATGYDDDTIAALLAGTPEARTDVDDTPPTPATPITRPGDVWQLGPHRLICGSATEPGDYQTVLDGARADLIWTDPPYGVDVVGGNRMLPVEKRKAKGKKVIENDDMSIEDLTAFLRRSFTSMIGYTRPGAAWYVAAPSGPQFRAFCIPLAELDVWHQTLIWDKGSLVLSRSDYHYSHEAIFYGWTSGAGHHKVVDRGQPTVWLVPRPMRSAEHPTMKPVALIERALNNSTNTGQIVLDPFAGSGSTLIAAHTTGRIARLIELDPAYCDVICRRYQQHTGITPTRDGADITFEGS